MPKNALFAIFPKHWKRNILLILVLGFGGNRGLSQSDTAEKVYEFTKVGLTYPNKYKRNQSFAIHLCFGKAETIFGKVIISESAIEHAEVKRRSAPNTNIFF